MLPVLNFVLDLLIWTLAEQFTLGNRHLVGINMIMTGTTRLMLTMAARRATKTIVVRAA